MRLARYERDGRAVAALADTRAGELWLIDLDTALRRSGVDPGEHHRHTDVPSLLADWPRLGPALGALDLAELPALPASDVRLLPPVGAGQLIVCCGFNYADHEAEVNGSSVGATWFIKNANSVIGPDDQIVIPPDNGETVDYEGELAVVFGRDCYRVAADRALDYVGGYTLVNDVSARLPRGRVEESPDAIRRGVIDTHFGKQYPSFCPVGPVVITADEIPDPATVTFTTSVNGSVKQRASLSDMRLGVADLIAWLSTVFEFRAGDVISTGSPAGSGVSQQPPRFLGSGDVVTVSCPAIGELTNTVAVHARASA